MGLSALGEVGEHIHRPVHVDRLGDVRDRKSTRLNSSHQIISYAVFCLKKKKNIESTSRENDMSASVQGRCVHTFMLKGKTAKHITIIKPNHPTNDTPLSDIPHLSATPC